MASSISNSFIDSVYDVAIEAGAYAGKVSGAGGGGFMMFMVDPNLRLDLIRALKKLNGEVMNFHFTKKWNPGVENLMIQTLIKNQIQESYETKKKIAGRCWFDISNK